VLFDGAVLTPEKRFILLNNLKNFTTALDEGQEFVCFRISKVYNCKIEL
jgi:hypothetical protein